jgi:hypothetical protein
VAPTAISMARSAGYAIVLVLSLIFSFPEFQGRLAIRYLPEKSSEEH